MLKWTLPSPNWANTLVQLTIKFGDRIETFI